LIGDDLLARLDPEDRRIFDPALALLISLLVLGWELRTAFYRAMTLMVVATPSAVVISIPAALLSALACAARGGVLFKGGRHLESAAKVQVVALDKTGTMTSGEPRVVAVVPFGGQEQLLGLPGVQGAHPPLVDDPVGTLSNAQVRLLAAAAIEHVSEHPLARAVVRGAVVRGVAIPEADDFTALTRMGAQATVGGLRLGIGRPTLWGQLAQESAGPVQEQERQGRTVVLLGDEQEPFGLIALADTLRPEAAAAIAALKRVGERGSCC
jgi:Cd2+/Zn2+-exporting ATPase